MPPTRDQLIARAYARGARVELSLVSDVGAEYYGNVGSGVFETEAAAWDNVLEALALVQPGKTLLTSPEFDETYLPKVMLSSGRQALARQCSRLEIRQVGKTFQVFVMDRMYLPNAEPQDVRQYRVECNGREFKTLGAAAECVGQLLDEVAARDAPFEVDDDDDDLTP